MKPIIRWLNHFFLINNRERHEKRLVSKPAAGKSAPARPPALKKYRYSTPGSPFLAQARAGQKTGAV
jgi:hypothetical protein